MRLKTFAALVSMAALSLLTVELAGAAKATTTIKNITIEESDLPGLGNYSGRIKSSKPKKCLKGRRVVVIHDSEPPFVIGETKTDENGNWTLEESPLPPSGDKVIVVVKQKRGCKKAERTFTYTPGS